jgi:EAL domain-containing protein (putative c-di-GMP-specific phosphodiesterase class I)
LTTTLPQRFGGVAANEPVELVRALGCDKIPGYIFSLPVTSTTVKAMPGQSRTLAAAA